MADAEFAKTSHFDVIVPQNTESDARELFLQDDGLPITDPSVIKQRKSLYFDEQLSIYIVLRTSRQLSSHIQECIKRLSISVDLRAQLSRPQDFAASKPELSIVPDQQQDDTVWRCSVGATDRPDIIAGRPEADELSNQTLLAVWRCSALIGRPRQRLSTPSIVFSASAFLLPSRGPDSESQSDPYLPSGEPSPENLLAPLGKIKLPTGHPPSLSSFRLNRVRPLLPDENAEGVYLDVHVPGPMPALVPISSRLRYLNPSVQYTKVNMVAMLDLAMSPYIKRNIELLSVKISVSGGTTTDLGKGMIPKLPLQCHPQDNVVLLYRLLIEELGIGNDHQGLKRAVDVSIKARVLSSDRCRPIIESQWTTLVDPSAALTSSGASPQSLQRPNRPSDLHLSDPKARYAAANDLATDVGAPGSTRLNLTFSGPSQAYVNKEFAVSVLISNPTSQSRSVVLSHAPNDGTKNSDFEQKASRTLVGSEDPHPLPDPESSEVARLKELRNGEAQGTPAILSLSAALDIGLLESRACHSTKLRYLPLRSGLFQIDPIRITDLKTGTFVDVQEMPTILIESADKE